MISLKERIDLYFQLSENIREDIIKHLLDTTIDIEERWTMLTKISGKGILGQDRFGDGFISYLNDNVTLYDDFYIEKYESSFYTDMYERILETKDEKNYEDSRILAWREAVLSSGQDSFIYDW